MDTTTVEINDAMFCQEHIKELCDDCGYDGREENDSFYGFDSIDRDGLECPGVFLNKDGVYECKKHSSSGCSQCFHWKRQLTRLRAQAKKEGRA